MQPPRRYPRIDLAELNAQLVKKLGPEVSKKYFSCLHRFLSLKLSKVEFNKLCLIIFGRENINLHNQFIRSILKNASTAKSPPPVNQKDDDVSKDFMHVGSKEIPADYYQQNGSHSNPTQPSCSSALSKGGDILPNSPHKTKSGGRNGDHQSALGIGRNGKAKFAHRVTADKPSDSNAELQNGNLDPPDIESLVQHHQETSLVPHPSRMQATSRLPDSSAPLHSQGQRELVVRSDSKQDSAKSTLRADMFSHGALLDSVMLREKMEHIASMHGLEGVSLDCANLLNLGLDSYLKGLIGSCLEFVGSRSGHELTKNDTYNHDINTIVNGVRPGYQLQMQSTGNHLVRMSLQEFRVGMELNPQQLGKDWPLLLEKISTQHASEE